MRNSILQHHIRRPQHHPINKVLPILLLKHQLLPRQRRDIRLAVLQQRRVAREVGDDVVAQEGGEVGGRHVFVAGAELFEGGVAGGEECEGVCGGEGLREVCETEEVCEGCVVCVG